MDDGEERVTCPYDPIHQILPHRLAKHLISCGRQHSNKKMLICPFNRSHVVHKFELEVHIQNCESNTTIFNVIDIEPPVKVGTVSLEKTLRQDTLLTDEDWSGSHPTYNPEVATASRAIVRAPNIVQTKAEKKHRKKQERHRMACIEKQMEKSPEKPTPLKPDISQPLRVPKKAAKVLTLPENELCSNFNSSLKLSQMKKSEDIEKQEKEKENVGNGKEMDKKKIKTTESHRENIKEQKQNLTNGTVNTKDEKSSCNDYIRKILKTIEEVQTK